MHAVIMINLKIIIMKATDFTYKKTFYNVFSMMQFCYKRRLTCDNSLLVDNEYGTHCLYYN